MRLFGRSPEKPAAHGVYLALVEQARAPVFYARLGVPDTLDGRFEMIALHMFLVLHRLRAEPAAQRFGQALYDVMFADMDRALREMGTGDLSVGTQVKRMAKALAGRIGAYQAGLAGDADLAQALRRNLYGTIVEPAPEHLAAMAAYLRRQEADLAGQPAQRLAAGTLRLAAVPVLDSCVSSTETLAP
jgi:cytochrome b pre-mRNA-processing protein 3